MNCLLCVIIAIDDTVMTHPAFPFLVNVNVSTFHQNGVAGSHEALE